MFTLRMSSSSERKVLFSFKNCLMRVIFASNKGLKKTGRSLIRMRLLFQMILLCMHWSSENLSALYSCQCGKKVEGCQSENA